MAPSPTDDAELIACMIAYQGGELPAFERLHALVAGDLERFFSAVLRDGSAAKDLAQETFLELHRARRSYLPPLPVRPWVFGIARNVERRYRRQAARRPTVAFDEEARAMEPRSSASPIERQDLTEALRTVPPARRAAWLLHHVHGWSFHEIAARLGIGVGAAKLRSSRATSTLRAFLQGERKSRDD